MNENSNENHKGSFPPWSRMPSLKEMTEEIGIDFDEFVSSIQNGSTVEEMSEKFHIGEAAVKSLQDHFLQYGISSVVGGD
jgi:hypothetical protein